MKYKILIIFLTFFSFNSYAYWKLIDKNQEYELYVEADNLKKVGNIISVNWMYSYYKQNLSGTKRTGYFKYQSMSFNQELNCVSREQSILGSTYFEFPMANGYIKNNSGTGKWVGIDSDMTGSGVKIVFNYLCQK